MINKSIELPDNPTISTDLFYADLRQHPVSVKGLGAIVVRDCMGTPLVVIKSYKTGHTVVSLAGQEDFQANLAEVGILQRVDVKTI